MTQGDKLFGIPTTYKGIEMRSKLETKVAMFLDALQIKWEYEPKTFLLSNGIPYKPDFYLTEIKMWVEVKGDIKEHNKEISKRFVEENKTELLLISAKENYWYSVKDFNDGTCEDDSVQIGLCSKCGKYFFSSNIGWFFCRNCNYHDGDHDMIYGLNNSWEEGIDFSDIGDIKRWLNARRISV